MTEIKMNDLKRLFELDGIPIEYLEVPEKKKEIHIFRSVEH